MIDRVHFENFKSLQDVTIDLGRLTALVGPNGCGKSSVLQGLHLLLVKAQASLDQLGQPPIPQRLRYRGGPGDMTLSMRFIDGNELRVEVREGAGKPAQERLLRPLSLPRRSDPLRISTSTPTRW